LGAGIWHDFAWPKQQRAGGVCQMDIRSRDFAHKRPCAAFSASLT